VCAKLQFMKQYMYPVVILLALVALFGVITVVVLGIDNKATENTDLVKETGVNVVATTGPVEDLSSDIRQPNNPAISHHVSAFRVKLTYEVDGKKYHITRSFDNREEADKYAGEEYTIRYAEKQPETARVIKND
jgi:hypothetical protein